MPHGIQLAGADGSLFRYKIRTHRSANTRAVAGFQKRVAYAAAHVVIDPLRTSDPVLHPVIDFDTTLAYRRHLWSLGFRVAEAMDTAQRGSGLTWDLARELIRLSALEAKNAGAIVACGANTDNVPAAGLLSLDRIADAYREQCNYIESCGAQVIIMASRALASLAQTPDDYREVYRKVLASCSRPVILHWLGDAFDPLLRGYWGSTDNHRAMDVCLEIIEENRARIDGIKISLLDDRSEIEMRRRLRSGVRMYTGDDFHYPELIAGDEHGYSDALLGIFDAIAPSASAALTALDQNDPARFRELLAPTLPLSRHIFEAPTYFYKTGIVLLAYLNGHQTHFRMLGGQESMRSVPHLCRLFVLADEAGLLRDPELAQHRMQNLLNCFAFESAI